MDDIRKMAQSLFERIDDAGDLRHPDEASEGDSQEAGDELPAGPTDEAEDEAGDDTDPSEAEDEAEYEDEEDADEGDHEDESETEALTVVIDGKEVEVTLDEARKGYQRQADYTRKTQRLAEERRAFEADLAAVREERAQYGELLTKLQQRVAADGLPEAPASDDPREWAAYQRKKAEWDAIEAEKAKLSARMQADYEAQRDAIIAQEQVKLKEALGWVTEDEGREIKSKLADYAYSLGFTDNDLEAAADHRLIVMLDKARRWDESQGARMEVRKKAAKSPTLKPGQPKARKSSGRKQVESLRRQLRQGGRIGDAAKLLETYTELD